MIPQFLQANCLAFSFLLISIPVSAQNLLNGFIPSVPYVDSIRSSEWLLDITKLERKDLKACLAKGNKRASSLSIQGKGGIPPELTAPLVIDTIRIEGEETTPEANQDKESKIDTLVKPKEPLSLDEIVPARGAIVLENGDVILTAYPTPNAIARTPANSLCS